MRFLRAPKNDRQGPGRRRWSLGVALAVLSAGLVVIPALPASAAIDSALQIEKTASSAGPYAPGDSFTYTVKVICASPTSSGCVDAQVVDDLPAPLVFDPVYPNPVTSTVAGSGTSVVTIAGAKATIDYTSSLGGSEVGLKQAKQATLTLRVKVPSDASADYTGTITNTAKVTAGNADPQSATAPITIAVPQHLEVDVAKERTTPGVIASVPGTEADFAIVGTNSSNQSVTSLTMQDPTNATTPATGPFQYLQVTGLSPFTAPAGAERVKVEWVNAAGTWATSYDATIPAGTTGLLPSQLANIYGLRFTFTSTTGTKIPVAGAATIGITTVTRANVTSIPANVTEHVTNTVTATVSDGSGTSAPENDSAVLDIANVPPSVSTTKNFDQDNLLGGETSVATIRTTNGPMPVHTMTISEPGTGDDLAEQGLLFEGFKASGIEWPATATSVAVVYTRADGTTETRNGTTVDALPAPTGSVEDVVGFEITFTAAGDGLDPYAYAVVPFTVKSKAVTGTTTEVALNTTTSTVTDTRAQSDTDTASDSLDRLAAKVATTVGKSFTPDELYAAPGSTTLVNLTAAVAPRPASTVGSDYLDITDPATAGATPSSFWSCFQIKNITDTAIPANTTLQVQKWDGTAWSTLTTVTGAVSSWNYTVPTGDRAAIQGLRFHFTRTGGGTLAPGFNVAPNFNVSVRAGAACLSTAVDLTIDNTVQSQVENAGNSLPAVTADDLDEVTLLPLSGTGPDMVDKTWVDPTDAAAEVDPVTVGALTDDTRIAKLKWSTQGFAFDSVVLSDPASPTELTNVASSVYDAFDLTQILPITAAQDKHIAEDKVSKVEVYSASASAWLDITTQACAAGCTGTFGGYTLQVRTGSTVVQGDTEDVQGVRLTFVSRTAGEPVAGSVRNDRVVRLGFTVREKRRSDPSKYVLGQHHTYGYNTGTDGMVKNTVLMVGSSNGFTRSTSDAADAVIIDRPLNVELTKSNTYSPLGLPPAGTPTEQYPTLDTDLVATNTTTSKVTGLRIQDPLPGTALEDSVFDTLSLYKINSISFPSGLTASDVNVGVTFDDGSTTTWTYNAALLKTAAELAGVVAIDLTASGEWIETSEKLTTSLTFQLRPTRRFAGTAMTVTSGSTGPENVNVARATVSGPGGTGVSCLTAPPGDPCDEVSAEAEDDFQIQNPSYDVVATKAINYTSRYEDESKTGYTATLTGQPTGTARTTLLTLTDSDPRFWNAFDLASITPVTPGGPVNQIRVSVLDGTSTPALTYAMVGSTLTPFCGGLTDLSACWKTGSWAGISGGTIATPMPPAVSASNVRGIKIEARSVQAGNAVQWERPNNQKVTVRLNLTRRANLWWDPTGTTPVPSTLPGMALAPGEPTQGTINNTLVVDGVASWGNPTASDAKWSGTGSAAASTVLRHRINKIRVRKGPGNPTSHPLFENGDTVPYAITVNNTGAYTMTGPSFALSDQITPVGGTSPVTAPATWGAFAAITGSGSTIGTDQPTATFNPTTGLLTFGFNNGFKLAPGGALTIMANLKIRDDLPAGTSILNSVTARADRDFEECRSTTDLADNPNTGSATVPVQTCTATTTVEVQSNAPLEMVKSVRGVGAGLATAAPGAVNHDDLGVLVDGTNVTTTTACEPGGSGAADAAGFYTWPCVPITKPGGTEEWKIDFTNSGNTNASVVAGIDVLPAVNDQGVVVPTPRGSKFGVTLLNEFDSNIAELANTADAELQLFFSTTVPSTTCNEADIKNTTTPGGLLPANACYADVTARSWTPVLPATDVSAAKAFKFVLIFGDVTDVAETTGLKPGETFSLTYQSTTPAFPERATAQAAGLAIAWNSVAAGSRMTAAGTQTAQPSMVTEPRQVGVAMPTGQLVLNKTVSAPTWATPVTLPASYAFDIECDSAGVSVPLTGPLGTEDRSTVTVPAGGTVTYNGGESPATTYSQVNVPWGSTCVLAETGQPAGDKVTYAPTNATLTAVTDLTDFANIMNPMPAQSVVGATLTATNTYSAGGFTVTKTVDDGGAVDQAGDPISYGPFGFSASCTYLAQETIAVANRTFTLAAGASKTFSDLPTGASCTVTETDDDGADTTSYVLTTAGTAGTSTTAAAVNFTILEGTTTLQSEAAFTNEFTTGSLEVTKIIDGDGATAWGNEDFVFHATCTLDGDTVYDGDSPAINKTSPVWTIEDLATGAACVITEPKKGGANSTVLDPVAGTATIGDGTTATVEVTNTFTLGALTVEKRLAGPAATDPGAVNGQYTMELTCTRVVNGATVAVVIPGGARTTIVGEDTYTWTGLPTGASCAIAEVDSVPSTPDVVVSPSSIVIGDDEAAPVDVLVTNTFETGSIELHKVVTGAAVTFAPTTFEVAVTCEFPVGTQVVLPNGGLITLNADGTPVSLAAIPTGSICTAAETDAGQTTVDYSPTSLTVGDATTVAMTVTNTYEAGALQIVKDLTGVGAAVAKGPFEFSFDCSFNGAPVAVAPVTVAVTPGATQLTSAVIKDLPVRTECTVTETAAGNAVVAAKPVTVTLTPGSDLTPVAVAFENKFGAGIVRVQKIAKGPYKKDPVFKKRPVKMNVTCEYTAGTQVSTVVNRNLKVLVGATETLVDAAGKPVLVPVGSVCWVSELNSLGATSVEIAHGTRATGLTVPAASAGVTSTLAFAVKNTYRTPPTGSVSDLSEERGGGSGGSVAGGGLSDTGSTVQPWLVGLMGMMLVAGAALIVTARRRRFTRG